MRRGRCPQDHRQRHQPPGRHETMTHFTYNFSKDTIGSIEVQLQFSPNSYTCCYVIGDYCILGRMVVHVQNDCAALDTAFQDRSFGFDTAMQLGSRRLKLGEPWP